jgi:hypothetical protein
MKTQALSLDDQMVATWAEPCTVTVLWPHHSRQPARPSSSSSNTSSGSTSQSTLEAVTPDTLDQQTAQILAVQWATQQEQYNKSTFPAQLVKAL